MRHLENIYTDLCSLRYLLANCLLSMSSFTLHIYDMIRLLIDLWLWEPIHHCPLTWWIFVPSFTEIRPLSTEISCHAKHLGVNGQLTIARGTQGRTQNFFCWRAYLYQTQTVSKPSIKFQRHRTIRGGVWRFNYVPICALSAILDLTHWP